jgi:site-specific DNA-methyltransferase (adenine-specific)
MSNNLPQTKKTKLIIEDDREITPTGKKTIPLFVYQKFRKDILHNLLNLIHSGTYDSFSLREIFELLMTNNNSETISDPQKGFIFESIIEMLIITKCFPNLHYSEIKEGKLDKLKTLNNIKKVLNKPLNQGGSKSDITLCLDANTVLGISCKYNNERKISKEDTDASTLNGELEKNINNGKIKEKNHKVAVFVADKTKISKSIDNGTNISEKFDKVKKDGLLFDKNDVIEALGVFLQQFNNNQLNIDDFMEMINAEYLLSPRRVLKHRLHAKIAVNKIINEFIKNKHRMFCLKYKPRTGKSIIMLSIAKYLLENTNNRNYKILFMTSIPSTIDDFVEDLEKYIDFKNIKYIIQDEFTSIPDDFSGMILCSTQYLKCDVSGSKKEQLKKLQFDATFIDECHFGSSTDKTKKGILNVNGNGNGNGYANTDINTSNNDDEQISSDIENIIQNVKVTIFASGTPDKTVEYFNIHPNCVYEWEIMDEANMKLLQSNDPNSSVYLENFQCMKNRHGNVFEECFYDMTLDKDYSKYPTQVLMKLTFSQQLIDKIKKYNAKYGTNYGLSVPSLFALIKSKNSHGKYEYDSKFELEKTEDGKEILLWLFKLIISDEPMEGKEDDNSKPIMTSIEETQSEYNSRKSTVASPKLFLMFLPVNTGNNVISKLQPAIVRFLKENNLWNKYHITYSNSLESGDGNNTKEYNQVILDIMNDTKILKKRGCILLLGNKGTTGVTYHDCDVTISLDDSFNMDSYIQKTNRALTDAPGKTIGINIDMNVQRTLLCTLDIIHKYKKISNTKKNYAEILQYLFEHKIFLFNPHEVNNGKLKTLEIHNYYQKVGNTLVNCVNSSINHLLNHINCTDKNGDLLNINLNLELLDFNKNVERKKPNSDLYGEQPDCPKGDRVKHDIDSCINNSEIISDATDATDKRDDESNNIQSEEETQEEKMNKMRKFCEVLIPSIGILSRSFKIYDKMQIFENELTLELLLSVLKQKNLLPDSISDKNNEKKINKDYYINIITTMKTLVEQNIDIINQICDIYNNVIDGYKLREMIANHFIPTEYEKNKFAEVATPLEKLLCMINIFDEIFWQTPKKVFEPCCGKGNIVLAIFDKMFNGLEKYIPNNFERCKYIINNCLYFADISQLNVFITTELLKCHIQSYCGYAFNSGYEDAEFNFNSYIGDTLLIDPCNVWSNLSGSNANKTIFNAIIGNPPYNEDPENSADPHKKPVYQNWIYKFSKMADYFVFITPSKWFTSSDKLLVELRNYMKKSNVELIQHYPEDDVFKGVQIKGGVSYFLINNINLDVTNKKCKFNGEDIDLCKYDIIVEPKYYNMVNTIQNYLSSSSTSTSTSTSSQKVLSDLYVSQGTYTSNDKTFELSKTTNDDILCYVSQNKGLKRWANKNEIKDFEKKWKIITTAAAYKGTSGFANMFIGKPEEIHSKSYISFNVNSKSEAENLLSYLKCKLPHVLLSMRKITHNLCNKEVFKWIPIPPLDRKWNNEDVYKLFNLSDDCINMIKNMKLEGSYVE